jgi:hypothetical protein
MKKHFFRANETVVRISRRSGLTKNERRRILIIFEFLSLSSFTAIAKADAAYPISRCRSFETTRTPHEPQSTIAFELPRTCIPAEEDASTRKKPQLPQNLFNC